MARTERWGRVSTLTPELSKVVEIVLDGTNSGDEISLDAIGDAIGARLVSQEQIDAILVAIESRGRKVAAATGGRGEEHLKLVIAGARELRAELGRPPKPEEIATKSGLSVAEVKHALSLVRIMQR